MYVIGIDDSILSHLLFMSKKPECQSPQIYSKMLERFVTISISSESSKTHLLIKVSRAFGSNLCIRFLILCSECLLVNSATLSCT